MIFQNAFQEIDSFDNLTRFLEKIIQKRLDLFVKLQTNVISTSKKAFQEQTNKWFLFYILQTQKKIVYLFYFFFLYFNKNQIRLLIWGLFMS